LKIDRVKVGRVYSEPLIRVRAELGHKREQFAKLKQLPLISNAGQIKYICSELDEQLVDTTV